jgi:hypothetical protein
MQPAPNHGQLRDALCKRTGIGYAARYGRADATMFLTRCLAAGIAVLAAEIAYPARGAEAPPSATAITCTNPASGARWQIRIDYASRTVDANPAHISDTKISWHEAQDGGNYTLDRASGKLTAIVASSTGGYFVYHSCEMKNSG